MHALVIAQILLQRFYQTLCHSPCIQIRITALKKFDRRESKLDFPS